MGKIWDWTKGLISALGDFQAVWAILPAGIISAVSGYSGYLANGLGWALFMASGVFCFLSVGYVVVRESYRQNKLDHKLNVSGIGMVQYPSQDAGQTYFRPIVTLQSTANFELEFELTRVDFNFGPVQGGTDRTTTLRGTIAPRDSANLTIPSGKGVPPLVKGRVVVEVKYGRAGTTLSQALSTTLECAPTNPALSLTEAVDLLMVRNVEKLTYAPIKA